MNPCPPLECILVHWIIAPGSMSSSRTLAAIPFSELTPAYAKLRAFGEEFKTKRISLGFTQRAVGQSLADKGYSNFSQSTISRFEQMQLSPTNAADIKLVLEKWLLEVESPNSAHSSSSNSSTMTSRKRKKRAVFTPQTRTSLDEFFKQNPRPNGQLIEAIAQQLKLMPEEVRVWFCNKRQRQKQSNSVQVYLTSTYNQEPTLSTASSGATSPSSFYEVSQVTKRSTLSPKTSPNSAHSSSSNSSTMTSRKRKKRVVFTPQTRTSLDEFFKQNPRPNGQLIEAIAQQLKLMPEEVRVWFHNKRQRQKQSNSVQVYPTSTYNQEPTLSTASSGATSPSSFYEVSQVTKRSTLSPKTSPNSAHSSSSNSSTMTSRKRKKRAMFTPQTRTSLDEFFKQNPRPNGQLIEAIAQQLKLMPEEVRVWFCNKRQRQKQSNSVQVYPTSTYNQEPTLSTASSGATSPSSFYEVSQVTKRSTLSPKTSFTIEELSKSSTNNQEPTLSTASSGATSPSSFYEVSQVTKRSTLSPKTSFTIEELSKSSTNTSTTPRPVQLSPFLTSPVLPVGAQRGFPMLLVPFVPTTAVTATK